MSKLILAVEDQEDNMQILRDLLTSTGYGFLDRHTVDNARGDPALTGTRARFSPWL